MIGRGKMATPQARVDAMAKYKMPKTLNQMRSFLGLANYYAKYVPSFVSHLSVLSPAIRKDQPSKIAWTPEMITVFKGIIQKICQHTQLVVPEHTDELCIFTDASTRGVGGSLCVNRDNQWQPCAYYTRQLLPREQKYSATELEAIALLATAQHFKFYVIGKSFIVYTDHKALCSLLQGTPPSNRLYRWKETLSLFDVDIVYLPGSKNSVADALSRQGWSDDSDNLCSAEGRGGVVD